MDDFEITLIGARTVDGQPSANVRVCSIPRIGERLSHDPSGIEGDVRSVEYWWSDGTRPTLQIIVEVR